MSELLLLLILAFIFTPDTYIGSKYRLSVYLICNNRYRHRPWKTHIGRPLLFMMEQYRACALYSRKVEEYTVSTIKQLSVQESLFYWHITIQHLIRPQFTVVLLKLIWHMFLSTLVWLAPGTEAKLKCTSEKSPVWCGHKEIRRFHVLINAFLVKKKKLQLWVGWPSLGLLIWQTRMSPLGTTGAQRGASADVKKKTDFHSNKST